MNFSFSEDTGLEDSIFKSLQRLKTTSVEIGIPSTASARSQFLLALHERGAPGAHIPPRPVVAPALGQPETQEAIAECLNAACEAAASGDPKGVQAGYEAAGKAGVDGIHAYIDTGIEPGNAPLTIHGGWIRNFSSGKPVHVPGKGFDKPLYDTGELYESFSYEMKSK